ncbi:MAG: amino acid adenylation domain-containing protein [Acetivibrionales bacterium]|jgi:amino acid adenylation domain-containing protein
MKDTIYYPLTSPQLSIWYTEKMYPNTSISNVAGTLRIKDTVDIGCLEKAINLFIKNNDGIRLRICLNDEGNPQQYVSEYEYKNIEIKDFSNLDDPIKAMQEFDSQETLKPFDLIDNELFRFIMIKISDEDAGFYFCFHHIITDAWSLGVIKNYIMDMYNSLKNYLNYDDIGHRILPSYTDFVKSDQIYKLSNRYQKDKLFWEQQFINCPEATVLKTRKSKQVSVKSKRKTFIAPKKFINKLRAYCEDNRITPYPLFLSALAMYINRTSEKRNLIIGTPILNRLNQIEKNTVGMFISTIPINIEISSEDSFSTFSQNIMEKCLSAFRHQRFPYEHILKNVREKHGVSDNLYDIVLSYQNAKINKDSDTKCSSRWHFSGYQTNSLTIHINDRDNEGVLILDYDYQSDLYYDKEIEFIHQHLLSLLWHALDNPNKMINKIEMLTENEKKKILFDFNDTYADYPREKTIHQLFEEQVERTPDNIALVFEDQRLTYKELNQKANSLAYVLRSKGVKRDEIVGIMVNRSLEMIIGILAILKAGGAYLPIEPEYPEERIKFLLQDSGMNIILTDNNNINRVTGINSLNIENRLNYKYSIENPINVNTPKDLAYVIYTSGSTGQPKGVMIEHVSVINFICAVTRFMDFSSNAVVLSTTTFCFDVFVFEVFTSLSRGAKIILANETEQRVPILTGELIYKHKVNKLITTPGKMKLILSEESNFTKLTGLEEILLAGEVFPADLLKEMKAHFKAKIYNGYGPTEATVCVSIKELSNDNKITVGKPISNIQYYIFDKNLNLLPIGIPGELYIGGDGLARGYLNREELTAKSFIQNPLSTNERLYKTGDVAKWYPKGEVDLLGRTDSQVKINGCRVELEEIKKNILQIPDVQDTIVINQIINNKQSLCAYIKSDKQLSVTYIREHLSRILPDYMVPSYISQIVEIPLNSNGKVDIKKLPDPIITKQETPYMAPKNNTQREVQSIWKKVLSIKRISINDNLFELGGDSLDVIAISTAIYKKYNITLPVSDIREINTISKMADFIEKESLSLPKKSGNLCLLKKGIKNIFFVHAGSGEISNYISLSKSIDEEYSCWGIRMGFNKYSPYNISLHELAQKYVNYITDIQPKGPYYLAGWCIGGTIAFEMANILEKRNGSIGFLGLFNSIAPRKWDNIELFTTDGEIKFIKETLGLDEFMIDESRNFTIDCVWENCIKILNNLNCNQVDEIKSKIPMDIRLAIPKFSELQIVEIMRYINCIRTLHAARALYFPERRISAKVHFFNALKDTIIEDKKNNIKEWNKYCRLNLVHSDLEANHFSMFQSPCVEELGDIINGIINLSEDVRKVYE